MAFTNEYKKELELLHERKSFGKGKTIPLKVKQLIGSGEISSILDFGAGVGKTSAAIRERYPNIKLHTYDPVTFPIKLPSSVDLVFSSDVLEHVEPHLIDETIEDLSNRATKYQYHLIACHPAKKALSDGRNAHLIIESPDWWREKINKLKGWTIIEDKVEEYVATVKKGPPINVIKYIVVLKNETSL